MAEAEDLDALSSRELHDRAIRLAVSRRDVRFLWRLLREIPAAQAAAGDLRRGETDVIRVSALISDLMRSGEGDVAEALRPIYLDYLRAKPVG
jgi:hypothetical protein